MAIIEVLYEATVHVEVDTTAGKVISVNVNDEDARLREGQDSPGQRAAIKVAETSAWPAWEMGF